MGARRRHLLVLHNEMEAEDRGEEDYENIVEECICAPFDLDSDDWVTYQYDLISRTDILKKLILNDNPAWLTDIRNNRITVKATFQKHADPITFRILCKDRFCGAEMTDASSHAERAWELLAKWGMFDLPCQNEMAFAVAFDVEGTIKKGGRNITSMEMREFLVEKPGSATD